jgi:inner membrane protein
VIAFNGRVHWGFALMLYLYLACVDVRAYHFLNPLLVIAGSLFPDSDHKHAPAGRILPLWLVFKHRGFTHTIWGLVFFSACIACYRWNYGVSFAIGYLSHILLDSLTPSGIKLFGGKRKAYRKG